MSLLRTTIAVTAAMAMPLLLGAAPAPASELQVWSAAPDGSESSRGSDQEALGAAYLAQVTPGLSRSWDAGVPTAAAELSGEHTPGPRRSTISEPVERRSPSGEENIALLDQTGTRNEASVLQSGAWNRSTILQAGSSNLAAVVQNGVGHASFVSQQGTGNKVSIRQ